VSTTLAPRELLKTLKAIERELGRPQQTAASSHTLLRNEARTVDLDILFYNDIVLRTENLTIPHARLCERDFVLTPLCDVAPHWIHPVVKRSVGSIRQSNAKQHGASDSSATALRGAVLHRVMALRRGRVQEPPSQLLAPEEAGSTKTTTTTGLLRWGSRTYVMGILNCTPDSFSDGGRFNGSVKRAVAHAKLMIDAGVDIIDVGGESTRPNATPVAEDEELARTVPVVKALVHAFPTVALSIDTYRSSVARACVAAGADMVNDVSGGLYDTRMLATVAELQVPYVAMHLRGTPATMLRCENTTYGGDGDVVAQVRRELTERVRMAQRAGVHLWNLLVDPGLGFAKLPHDSFALLCDLTHVSPRLPLAAESTTTTTTTTTTTPATSSSADHATLPVLVGPSRKGFIGHALRQARADNEDDQAASSTPRVFGTAAAVTGGIAAGADIVRVHDVPEMRAVSAVADAMYRRRRRRR
jgi:dihydroneopterin aldolase/2-amino-4-hydroxy-6-hydroxymethyldihydropteridine diphosphokinase/dihydropteroate synthase/2-amino-4-hydroxy-6-hydroxymethyldihydropteridine diphosphokinase/dihydropteroate synthase